jgi:hypothetical protein
MHFAAMLFRRRKRVKLHLMGHPAAKSRGQAHDPEKWMPVFG